MTRFVTDRGYGARPTKRARAALGSAGRQDDAGRAEAQLLLRRRGQVELAPGDVRAAVDDADPDAAPVVAERHLRAARERLVGDAHHAVGQPATAPEAAAVEAGPVPGRDGASVHVGRPDAARCRG